MSAGSCVTLLNAMLSTRRCGDREDRCEEQMAPSVLKEAARDSRNGSLQRVEGAGKVGGRREQM